MGQILMEGGGEGKLSWFYGTLLNIHNIALFIVCR